MDRFRSLFAALARDVGTAEVEDRAHALRTEISVAGLAPVEATLELALCFHHAVRGDHEGIASGIGRLRELTSSDDYAYYTDIAHFMAGLPLPDGAGSGAQWLGWEEPPRVRWRGLVMSRRRYLSSAR
ncbi:hypothetical protein OG727_34190 [Streptomyces caniferus]|uniref:Tetratrico peptide repeat group 5 domain-containing protein n=1 Tax=Streptomyces caniferus TaxID=285557 RepID=A0ABZ1VVU8_9ACTN|nr:hypothetical protein [Streptomyces caniferus]